MTGRKTRLVLLKQTRPFILAIVLTHSVLLIRAQEEWKLKQDKEGIKIYSRVYANSKIKALKVVCMVDASLSQVAAILLDIKSQDEWFYHTKSTVLKQVSPVELYYYAELEFPFPFSNRDFVEHITLSQNPETRILSMDVQNVPDYIPKKKYCVRVLVSECRWTIIPVGKNSVSIEFTLFADPAGAIPAWLINFFSTYGPFETFKKLKVQLKKPEYAHVILPFIKN